MPGFSLHIGLNRIDPSHYGSDGALQGCINDANDMQAIADSLGYRSAKLLDGAATVANVSGEIRHAAASLTNGDIFFVSYSGHGGQVPDTNGDEGDSKDETWCLFDRQLIDDELYSLWSEFQSGVRIIVLSDSCHSGTVLRALLFERAFKDLAGVVAAGFRTLPKGLLDQIYRRHKDMYDRIQLENPQDNRALVQAHLILISGCQDWQLSADGTGNGLFTERLKTIWNNGVFDGSYLEFHQEIASSMPNYQKPNYYREGVPSAAFDNQQPFRI
jgi:metacaspase-1